MAWKLAAAAVAAVVAAGSEVAAGYADKQEADFQRKQIETQALQADAEASAQKLERERTLEDMLGTQRSLFAARGRQVGIGSAGNLSKREVQLAENDIARIELNRQSALRQYDLAGQSLRSRGKTAVTMGYIKGAGRLFSAAADYGSGVGTQKAGVNNRGGPGITPATVGTKNTGYITRTPIGPTRSRTGGWI